jgi:iron(III) transport system permease protein
MSFRRKVPAAATPGQGNVVSAARVSRQSPLRRVRLFPVAVGLLVASVATLVIYPLARLFYGVFFGSREFGNGGISAAYHDPNLVPALGNTGLLLITAGGGALVIGTTLAWVNERTDARVGWLTDILPIIPLLVPPIAQAVGWVFLLAPTGGLFNGMWRSLFGNPAAYASGPLNIYSLGGMIFVTMIYLVPFAYLTVAAALQNVDPALEEASRVSGAGMLRTLRRVTVPSIRSSFATAAVLILLMTIAIFSIPIIIGLQAHVDVLSTVIFRVIYQTAPPRLGEAVALSAFMFMAVQVAIIGEYLIKRRRRHATISGRSSAGVRTHLGVWKWPVRILMIAYLLIATVAPIIGMAIVSLQHFWSSTVVWGKLSFINYTNLFSVQSALRSGLENSLLLGIVTATVLMAIAAVLTFFIHSTNPVFARIVDAVTGLPASLPHVVIGIAFLVVLGSGSHNIGGTLEILFLAYVVVLLPQATRSAGAAFSQVGRDLWDASSLCGASPIRTFVRILLPLMFAGLMAGWVIVFVQAFSEISASVFLSRTTNPVVGPVILDVWTNSGTFPQLAALTIIVTAIQATVVFSVLVLRRRRLRYRGR